MALIDRIKNPDLSGVSQENKDKLLKGLAYRFGKKNKDGTLDISSPEELTQLDKELKATTYIAWAKEAAEYESVVVTLPIDITDI